MIKKSTEKSNAMNRGSLVWFFLKGCKSFFLLCALCGGISTLADMLTPQIISTAIDHVLGSESAESLSALKRTLIDMVGGLAYLREHMIILAAAVMIAAVFKVIGYYGFRVFNSKGSETLVKNMRDTLYNHIERLPFQWHMQNHTGDIIQRCTSDIDTTRNFISEQLTNVFRIVITLILSMVFMFGMNIKLTLIAMIPLPFIVLYSARFHNRMREHFTKCDENEGKLSAMAQENLTGVRVVRAFGRERYEKDRFEAHNEYYTGLWCKMGTMMATFWSSADVLSALQILLVVVFGVLFTINGDMTKGQYVAFISYNASLTWPIRMLGRMISEMSKAGVAIDRIAYIMNSEEEKDHDGCAEADMTGDIRFEHVSFAYENCPEMLHDIDITIPAGSTLGILGGTGSGKSTMMYLLDRLYPLKPECGRITIGGTNIADIKLSHLRNNIGIVLQEPFLFSRTLRENLSITDGTLTEDDIREASRTACLEETIDSFTKGYDTFVGERGVTLSGGQKQRAAIARMLTQKTPIMVFDDSLSAVDTETDAKIRTALEQKFGTATIILISHRITTLNKADRVLVLDKGRVSQFGTPEELRGQEGLFKRIYDIQSFSAEEVQAQ